MSLDPSKLQKMRYQGSAIVAQCPACAAENRDRQGNHLFVAPDGRFGCVLYPGAAGRSHRKKIFKLAGIKDNRDPARVGVITVKGKNIKPPEVIESDVLGRLGRLKTSPSEPEDKERGGG